MQGGDDFARRLFVITDSAMGESMVIGDWRSMIYWRLRAPVASDYSLVTNHESILTNRKRFTNRETQI
jgi:hypothetical protein